MAVSRAAAEVAVVEAEEAMEEAEEAVEETVVEAFEVVEETVELFEASEAVEVEDVVEGQRKFFRPSFFQSRWFVG